jgi:hypothetical protein
MTEAVSSQGPHRLSVIGRTGRSFLHADALISGLVWVSVGVIYAVVLTKVTGKRLADLGMDESAATEVEEAFATEPRTGPRVLAGV